MVLKDAFQQHGSAEEDKQQIAEVDAIRLKALRVIHDALNL